MCRDISRRSQKSKLEEEQVLMLTTPDPDPEKFVREMVVYVL